MPDTSELITIYVYLGEEAGRTTIIEAQTQLLGEPWITMTTAESGPGFPRHFMVAVRDDYRNRLRSVEDRIWEVVSRVVTTGGPRFSVRLGDHPVWEDDWKERTPSVI
ncbi:hypothetical protein AMJ39_06920 [candidate division TA06 bacterium DG_24]|uniref:Uncharacterized protein n=3 Tax=Bacteria division TA06 TaxID=1156500 RepID=A0A0S8JAE3_UNCT6|nr:MAG: hypothetical protein AMJ39_06920 [candidate division TA06 bacterium DG_24]KPK68518.1 MAG: hypothetical protein AMJ82_08030 [candidate division TA06 bacterium SM23_40]KPL06719.1 MAG: hypothetical protein AMJ71_09475 [candidate division TA06 bacterium SM1_40]